MKKEIELDENRVLEVQATNLAIMSKAESAAVELEKAIAQKRFGPDGEMILQEAERQGKEVSRALAWWQDEFIGPVVDGARSVWLMLCDRRSAISDPLKAKKDRLGLAVGRYRAAFDADKRTREEAERQAREKEEEERRLAEAVELEKSGKNEEAEQIVSEPIFTAPVTFASPEKTKGVGQRVDWKFELTSEELIPRQFMTPNLVEIGRYVRLQKDKCNIPGIKVYAVEKASFSSK